MSKLPIVERLLAVESSRKFGRGTGDMDNTTCWYRNPDGPEAATTITELVSALESLVKGECPDCKGWGEHRHIGEMVSCRCNGKYVPPITYEEIQLARTALSNTRGDTKNDKG